MRVRSSNRAVKWIAFAAIAGGLLLPAGCGGSHGFSVPPIVLTVTVNENPIRMSPGETVYIPVMVMAPTETVSFSILGLPGGISASYKESESNPSGLLTLIANTSVKPGSYPCTITVGSSQQTASTTVQLNVKQVMP